MNMQTSRLLFRSWTLLLVFLASASALWAAAYRALPPSPPEKSAPAALKAPPAAVHSAGRQDSRDADPPARGVRILSPQDGSTIRGQGKAGPIPHPVDGDIYGFDQGEIRKFRLTVEVSVLTDKEYPQGIVEVRDNGTWRLPTAWFGGSRHIVRAVLMDGNGNEIHSHEVSVRVVH